MTEEWPEPGQECIRHYYHISMQVFTLLALSRNKQMHRKCSLHGSRVQSSLASGVRQNLQPCRGLAWRDEGRPTLLSKDEPTIYRDFSLGLIQACIGP